MFTIELYIKYLHNSLHGKSKREQLNRLKVEKFKIAEIINNIDNCFYGDQSLKDTKDNNLYLYKERHHF